LAKLTDLYATHAEKFQEIVVFLARQLDRDVADLSAVERQRIEAKAARLTANWNEVKHLGDHLGDRSGSGTAPALSKGELLRLLKEHWEISTQILDVRDAALARARAT
jgi:hypothetical protein